MPTPEEIAIAEAEAEADADFDFEQEQLGKSMLGGPKASIGLPSDHFNDVPPTLINKGIGGLNAALDYIPGLGADTIPYVQDEQGIPSMDESGRPIEVPAQTPRTRAAGFLQGAIPTATGLIGGGLLSPGFATAGDLGARYLNKQLGLMPSDQDEFSDYKKFSLENPALLNATLGYALPAAKAVTGYGIKGALAGAQQGNGLIQKAGKVLDPILNPQRLGGDALEKVVGEPLESVASKMRPGVSSRTVAEAIDDPQTRDALARVQDALTKNKDPQISRMVDEANLARVSGREGILDDISKAAEVSPYESGRKIMSRRDLLERMESKKISRAYDAVPKNQPIKISEVKQSIVNGLDKFAGPGSGNITPKASEFLEEVFNAPDDVTLEMVQNWRKRGQSLSASLYRSAEPEAKMSANIVDSFNDTLDTVLEKQGGKLKEAIDITRGSKQKFNRGIAKQLGKRGDYAERAMKPENVVNAVLKDKTNAEQFMAGIGRDPAALQEIKDNIGVKLRSVVGEDGKLVRWIDQHKDQLKTILEGDYSKIQNIYDDALSRLKVGRSAEKSFRGSQTRPLGNIQDSIDEALGIKDSSIKKTLAKTLLKGGAGAYVGSGFGPGGAFIGGMLGAGQQAAFSGGRKKAMREMYKLTSDPELLSGFLKNRKDLTLGGIMKGAAKEIPSKGVVAVTQALRTVMQEDDDDSLEQPIKITKPKSQDFRSAPKGVVLAKSSQQPRMDSVLKAIAMTESAGNPKAVSKAGAKGLMQFMDATAKEYGVEDPFDPVQSIRGAKRYMEYLIKRFGDLRLALAAYNRGPTALDSLIKRTGKRDFEDLKKFLPKETAAYVPKVEKFIAKYEGEA